MTEPAIVAKPYDALVSVGSTVAFNCSTDDTSYPLKWRYIPTGSTESFEIAPNDRVNATVYEGRNDLVIENVTVGHAGYYTCYDERFDGVRASAELNVVESRPNCYFVTGVYSSTAEIKCEVSIVGKKGFRLINHPFHLIHIVSYEKHKTNKPSTAGIEESGTIQCGNFSTAILVPVFRDVIIPTFVTVGVPIICFVLILIALRVFLYKWRRMIRDEKSENVIYKAVPGSSV